MWMYIVAAIAILTGIGFGIYMYIKSKQNGNGGTVDPPIDPPIEKPVDWEDAAYLYHFKDKQPPIADSEYKDKPYQHWLDWGKAAGWQWKPDGWSSAQYLKNNPDIKAAGVAPLLHYWQYGQAEGRSYMSEIIRFDRLPDCDIPSSCYFAIQKFQEKMYFGTYGYQGGVHSSEIYDYPPLRKIQDVEAESVFAIREFKGKFYFTAEHGKFGTADRGMIFMLDANGAHEVYRHPRWNLMLNLHVHDGYLYATGMNYGNPSDPAGVVRSADGVNWEVYFENPNEYRFFGMCSRGSELWIASTSSGVDWGANNCNPSVFCNGALIWRDSDRPNCGNWGIACFKGDIYIGGTGVARVTRISDRKTVIEKADYNTVMDFAIDPTTNTLFAFFGKDQDKFSGGACIMATKDGNNWYQVGGLLDATSVWFGYYDPSTQELWVAGGQWAQGSDTRGYGRIYKSVRG